MGIFIFGFLRTVIAESMDECQDGAWGFRLLVESEYSTGLVQSCSRRTLHVFV